MWETFKEIVQHICFGILSSADSIVYFIIIGILLYLYKRGENYWIGITEYKKYIPYVLIIPAFFIGQIFYENYYKAFPKIEINENQKYDLFSVQEPKKSTWCTDRLGLND